MLVVVLDWFLIGVLQFLCLYVHSSLARSIYSLLYTWGSFVCLACIRLKFIVWDAWSTVSMHEYLVFKFSLCWCSWFILEIRQYLPAWLMHSGFKLLGLSSSLHGGNSVSLHDWLALTLHD